METEMAMMETETGAEKRMVNARRDRGSGGTGSAGSACFQLEGQRKHNGRVLGTQKGFRLRSNSLTYAAILLTGHVPVEGQTVSELHLRRIGKKKSQEEAEKLG